MALADAPTLDLKILPQANTSKGIVGRDGRGPFRCDLDAVIRATERAGLPALDFDHALERDPAAPKAGYCIRLFQRDGAIWGSFRLTERGHHAIHSGEYRYISPTFRHRKGDISALVRAGLTNNPNLFNTAINIANSTTEKNSMEANKLDVIERQMIERFGVSEEDYLRSKSRAEKGERTIDLAWRPKAKPSRLDTLFKK